MMNEYEVIDLIPFHPVPTAEEMGAIAINRNLTEVGDTHLGRGASRDVYTLQDDPANYVIKVLHNRKNSSERFGNQNFTEIQTYLSYERIRKWLPMVASYDPVAYRWIVSERCVLDRANVWKQISDYRRHLLSMVTLRLKEVGATKEQVGWLIKQVEKRHGRHIHDSHVSLVRLIRRSPLARGAIDMYADNNYNGKLIVDCLWHHLSNDDLKMAQYIKRNKKVRSSRPMSSWELLVRIVTSCHPLVCDLAIESVDRNVRFSDLHEANIGISRSGKKYLDLRLVDVGMTRRRDNERRLTPTGLILPPPPIAYQRMLASSTKR